MLAVSSVRTHRNTPDPTGIHRNPSMFVSICGLRSIQHDSGGAIFAGGPPVPITGWFLCSCQPSAKNIFECKPNLLDVHLSQVTLLEDSMCTCVVLHLPVSRAMNEGRGTSSIRDPWWISCQLGPEGPRAYTLSAVSPGPRVDALLMVSQGRSVDVFLAVVGSSRAWTRVHAHGWARGRALNGARRWKLCPVLHTVIYGPQICRENSAGAMGSSLRPARA